MSAGRAPRARRASPFATPEHPGVCRLTFGPRDQTGVCPLPDPSGEIVFVLLQPDDAAPAPAAVTLSSAEAVAAAPRAAR
jgi:hypothetical protein